MSYKFDNKIDDKIDDNFPKYESDSIRLTVAKKCSSAIINEAEDELDPEETEVLDFACGTGNVHMLYTFINLYMLHFLTKYFYGIGLISQALCPYVKSIIGVDTAQAMVDEYNKRVWQQGIDENEMKAICLELKESKGDQLNGRKFDLIVASIS